MSDGETTACAHCESTNIRPRQPNKPVSHGRDGEWRCRDCGRSFDEPVRREREVDSARRGLAGALEAADSLDDVEVADD